MRPPDPKPSVSTSPPTTQPGERPTSTEAAKGFSAFLAKVLDQLSITSWMPALFLVGNSAVLISFINDSHISAAGAISDLVAQKWGIVIVLIFAVVICALIIQAFEFELLRNLEGYFRSHLLGRWAVRRIGRHEMSIVKLDETIERLQEAAFGEARLKAIGSIPDAGASKTWDIIWKAVKGAELDSIEKRAYVKARDINWVDYASGASLHRWEIAEIKRGAYPKSPNRALPTRLGNVMRAAEDEVELEKDEDLEGFIIRNYDQLPKAIQEEHDSFRSRLEMYCSMMLALAILVVISVVCLWGSSSDLRWRIAIPLLYALSIGVCYEAAIASATGFGQALKEANRHVQNAEK